MYSKFFILLSKSISVYIGLHMHRGNLVGGKVANKPPIFFIPKKYVLAAELETNKKIGVRVGGKGYLYIKEWLKPNFPPLSNLAR